MSSTDFNFWCFSVFPCNQMTCGPFSFLLWWIFTAFTALHWEAAFHLLQSVFLLLLPSRGSCDLIYQLSTSTLYLLVFFFGFLPSSGALPLTNWELMLSRANIVKSSFSMKSLFNCWQERVISAVFPFPLLMQVQVLPFLLYVKAL